MPDVGAVSSDEEISFAESVYEVLERWFDFQDSLPITELAHMCETKEDEIEMQNILRGSLFRDNFVVKGGSVFLRDDDRE